MMRWIFRVIFLIVLLLLLSAGALLFFARAPHAAVPPEEQVWGVTFSAPYAEALGLEPRETFAALLDELGVRHFRLSAYWNVIEPEDDAFTFDALDWQLEEAHARGAAVILGVGRRLPRWPECHVPQWAQGLTEQEQQAEILEMLSVVVEHYRDHPAIVAWQVDNEPFLATFGECPKPDEAFFAQEVALVREHDPSRPIVVTDSGELGWWVQAARHADIFGTTMYRVVPRGWVRFGYTHYPLPAFFYRAKANLVSRFFVPIDDLIVSELQAEPWTGVAVPVGVAVDEQYRSVGPEQLRKNIEYGRRSGIRELYLWGAEWWYWIRAQGHPEPWDIAAEVFAPQGE